MIRSIKIEDLDQIKKIHENFYQNEFSLPDFIKNYLCAFVSVTKEDRIISVCGIRKIVELVAITDKAISARNRRDGLVELLQASSYMASKFGYDQLHAFIQEENWLGHLKDSGFQETKGKSVFINI